jgi:porin
MKRLVLAVLLLGLHNFGMAAESPTNNAETPASLSSSNLIDKWRAKRDALSEKGYDWQFVYKLDLLRKVSSPNQKNFGLDNLDIKLALDGEKIAGIKGSSALLYVLSNHGSKPAVQGKRMPHGLDNIETPEGGNTLKLYQAWVQQNFLDDKISVRVGTYDLNSEFYVTESSGMFIHPTFGIGAEMAGTGENGPSVFPTASVAIRTKLEPAPGYYLQAVTLDGVPGDPNNHQGTHVQFNKGDGALNVVEAGIPLSVAENAHDNKLSLGVWRYTARFDDLLDASVKQVSRGQYAMLEKVLSYKLGGKVERIKSFLRAGKTDGDTSQFDMAWSAGLVFSEPFAGRDQDELGVAFAQERNGAKYRAVPGNSAIPHEKSFELTYRYQAMNGLVLQPIAQYLLNHSSDPTQDKTWWLGIRFEATL